MTGVAPDWLTARPIAHRGLHDAAAGLVENTLSAATAAIGHGYAIECDVQVSADGEAFVFHDFETDRLTTGHGRLDAMSAEAVTSLGMRATRDPIATFARFLAHVGTRVPVICEIKSGFNRDLRLATRVAETAATYAGPLALKSFDPVVMAHLQENRSRFGLEHVPLGMIAKAAYDDHKAEWAHLPALEKIALSQLLHIADTRPEFLAYGANDLPHAVPLRCRTELGLPVLAWTLRDPTQEPLVRPWADQIIFEGWRPAPAFAGS